MGKALYTMTSKPFFIDIFDSSNNKLSAVSNIMSLTTIERLNGIGEAVFMLPGNDPVNEYINDGSEFQIYDEIDGDLGRFLFRSRTLSDMNGQAVVTIQCWSVMRELTFRFTGFAREYNLQPLHTTVDDLVTSIAGWSTDTTIDFNEKTTVSYQGQSILEAIEELANRWGYHFRIGTGRELIFKILGTVNSNVRLVGGLRGQTSDIDNHTEVALITNISESTDRDGIINRVIALGAGTGAGQVTLERQTDDRHGYIVASVSPSNGQTYWYIEDAASIASYGAREAPIIFEQVKPILNSITAKIRAANELMYAAEEFLLRHKDPRVQYEIGDIRALRANVEVGDKIALEYRGIVDGYKYIDVDNTFWLMELQRDRDAASGDRVARVVLSNVDKQRTDDVQMWRQLQKRVRSNKLLITPTPFRLENSYYDLIQSVVGGAGKTARFTISIDDTVTEITRVIIRFVSKPLFSPIGAIINPAHPSGAGTTVDVAFVAQEHDQYPRDISCELNAVNIDNHVNVDYLTGGTGPWNPDPANASVTVEMDVTDLILADAGGLYQDFSVEFTCEPTSVAQDITMQGNTTTSTAASHGMIECTIKIQGIAQAIYKS